VEPAPHTSSSSQPSSGWPVSSSVFKPLRTNIQPPGTDSAVGDGRRARAGEADRVHCPPCRRGRRCCHRGELPAARRRLGASESGRGRGVLLRSSQRSRSGMARGSASGSEGARASPREQDPETFLAARREIARRYRERRRTDPVWRAKQTEAERERRAGFSEEERARASRAAVERKRRRRSLAARGLTERAGTTYIPTYIGGGITRLAGASESRMRLLRKAQLTRGFSRSRTELASAHGGS
jgi:hypothetical protein